MHVDRSLLCHRLTATATRVLQAYRNGRDRVGLQKTADARFIMNLVITSLTSALRHLRPALQRLVHKCAIV